MNPQAPVLESAPRNQNPYIIEGPGEVAIEYRPAGLGSRFLAALIDHAIALGVLLAAANVLVMITGDMPFAQATLLFLGLAFFGLQEGRHGRTIGKIVMGLRVLSDDGRQLAPRATLIRTLLRVADFFPLGFPGVVVMLLDPHGRRLGDLLAGTVVVREDKSRYSRDLLLRLPFRERPSLPRALLERIHLSPNEYQALRCFCFRTRTISRRQRMRLGRSLLAPLFRRANLHMPKGFGPEQLLVDLLHRENHTFGQQAAGVVFDPAPPPPD